MHHLEGSTTFGWHKIFNTILIKKGFEHELHQYNSHRRCQMDMISRWDVSDG
jgi:hypothetical protein